MSFRECQGFGNRLVDSGRHSEAVEVLGTALKAYPGFVPARVELAWILCTSWHDAVRDAGKAATLIEGIEEELGMQSIRLLDVEAAILAERGAFGQAAAMQEKAVKMAEEHRNDGDYTDELKLRLGLYRAGLPFRLGADKTQADR